MKPMRYFAVSAGRAGDGVRTGRGSEGDCDGETGVCCPCDCIWSAAVAEK